MHSGMIDLFEEIARVLEASFLRIERLVPAPRPVERSPSFVFRYTDENLEAAIVQKSARLVSGLNASLVLLKSGYVQELGALFRMLDEFSDDIIFLCQAIRTGDVTALHKEYLKAFYEEEFEDSKSAFSSAQKRPMVSRKKIHAAIARLPEQQVNASDAKEMYRTLSKAYSGYVHAASPHVMEMYGGIPPAFHISGMLHTPRIDEFIANAWDYFYRGLLTITMVALSFKQKTLSEELLQFRFHVEARSGRTEWEHPGATLQRAKTSS